MTVINFTIISKQNKQSKTDNKLLKLKHILQLDKQRTNEVQMQRSLEILISLQYYKGKPLSFKAAIVTSPIDPSALIPSGGFKLVQ